MPQPRYQVIHIADSESWIKNCPVSIERYQILIDTTTLRTLFRVRLFNASDQAIRSIYLNLKCFDDTNDFIGEMNDVSLQGILGEPHSTFGDSAVTALDFKNTTNVRISVSKIAYTDGSIWRDTGQTISIQKRAPIKISKRNKYYSQLERICQEHHVSCDFQYYEDTVFDYWICSCGQMNDSERCVRCGTDKSWLAIHFSEEFLEQESKNYQEQRNLLEQQQQMESSIIEKEKERRKKEKKRHLKRNLIIVAVSPFALALLLVLAIFLISIISPDLYSYYKAQYYTKTSQTTKAISTYEALEDYKDSSFLLLQNKYSYVKNNLPNQGTNYMNYIEELVSENYQQSRRIYEIISNWTFNTVLTASDKYTSSSALSISSKDTVYVYVTAHCAVSNDSIQLKVVTQLPGCKEKELTTQALHNGECIRQQYWYNNQNGSNGTFTCKLYDKKTGAFLSESTIPIHK